MLEECTCTTYTSPCSFDQTVQDADSAGKGAKGFKAAKEADRKASAGNRSAWNTLFMRPDTVAAAIAEHYGVSRAELLDRDASGMELQVPENSSSILQYCIFLMQEIVDIFILPA